LKELPSNQAEKGTFFLTTKSLKSKEKRMGEQNGQETTKLDGVDYKSKRGRPSQPEMGEKEKSDC